VAKETRSFDLIILGGGIAGMTAAIFAARANLKTVLLEEQVCGGLANWTNSVENFPSQISISGMELMERVLAQVEHLGVTVDQSIEVERLEIDTPIKTVETWEAIYIGKAIILATGRQPIRLDLETDVERIHYCSVCDGSAYAGKKVLVVGGGNSGFDESLYLLSLGVKDILLIEALEKCCACQSVQDRLGYHENVEIRTSTAVKAICKEDKGCRVTVKNLCLDKSDEVYVDGIFVFIGQKPNTGLFKGLIELDTNGYIIVGENRQTSLPGVYAAGDVIQKSYRYLTTAMADGTIAALACEKYIRNIGEAE
jgi:thioredoxin reductase (NADPH)